MKYSIGLNAGIISSYVTSQTQIFGRGGRMRQYQESRNDAAGRAFFASTLLDILLPRGGYVVILAAYFDECELNSGIFSVSGLAFRKSRIKKFNAEWRSLFAKYGGTCHMTDLHARKDKFNGISSKEADRLMRGAVEIINNHTAFGCAVACSLSEMNQHLPKWIDGFSHAYPFLCQYAMISLGDVITKAGKEDEIAYVFECGHERQREAKRLLNICEQSPIFKNEALHRSHAFVPKKDAPPLQGADVFVWEYARYWDLTAIKNKIPMRKSLVSILTNGYKTTEFEKKFRCDFLTGPPLWNAMKKYEGLGLLQLEENAAAKNH
jgi:hypothetical protein